MSASKFQRERVRLVPTAMGICIYSPRLTDRLLSQFRSFHKYRDEKNIGNLDLEKRRMRYFLDKKIPHFLSKKYQSMSELENDRWHERWITTAERFNRKYALSERTSASYPVSRSEVLADLLAPFAFASSSSKFIEYFKVKKLYDGDYSNYTMFGEFSIRPAGVVVREVLGILLMDYRPICFLNPPGKLEYSRIGVKKSDYQLNYQAVNRAYRTVAENHDNQNEYRNLKASVLVG